MVEAHQWSSLASRHSSAQNRAAGRTVQGHESKSSSLRHGDLEPNLFARNVKLTQAQLRLIGATWVDPFVLAQIYGDGREVSITYKSSGRGSTSTLVHY